MNQLLNYWNEFRGLQYSDEILIVIGGLIAFFAIMRIVQNSLKMLFWVVLAAMGLAAAGHGADRAPWSERAFDDIELSDYVERGGASALSALQALCWKLDDSVAWFD